jgi:DNA-damage-inducible protein J
MAETTNVTVHIDKDLMEQAENLFSEMGMNLATALNIFIRQSLRQGKIPFEISINTPNATTLAAIQEIDDMRSGRLPKHPQRVEDFLAEMGE